MWSMDYVSGYYTFAENIFAVCGVWIKVVSGYFLNGFVITKLWSSAPDRSKLPDSFHAVHKQAFIYSFKGTH